MLWHPRNLRGGRAIWHPAGCLLSLAVPPDRKSGCAKPVWRRTSTPIRSANISDIHPTSNLSKSAANSTGVGS